MTVSNDIFLNANYVCDILRKNTKKMQKYLKYCTYIYINMYVPKGGILHACCNFKT